MSEIKLDVWSLEDRERIAALWNDGRSGLEIAKALSTPERPRSRSSVIGLMHRMGFKRGPAVKEAQEITKRRRTQVIASKRKRDVTLAKPMPVASPKAEKAPVVPAEPIPAAGVGTELVNLPPNACRAPVAERDGVHLFCANPLNGKHKNYCAHCAPKMIRTVSLTWKQKRELDLSRRAWGRHGW